MVTNWLRMSKKKSMLNKNLVKMSIVLRSCLLIWSNSELWNQKTALHHTSRESLYVQAISIISNTSIMMCLVWKFKKKLIKKSLWVNQVQLLLSWPLFKIINCKHLSTDPRSIIIFLYSVMIQRLWKDWSRLQAMERLKLNHTHLLFQRRLRSHRSKSLIMITTDCILSKKKVWSLP